MNIDEIREALAGMTLPEIAEGSGVSPRAVFNFMHGKVTPSPETLERMRAFIDGPEHHQQALARFDTQIQLQLPVDPVNPLVVLTCPEI